MHRFVPENPREHRATTRVRSAMRLKRFFTSESESDCARTIDANKSKASRRGEMLRIGLSIWEMPILLFLRRQTLGLAVPSPQGEENCRDQAQKIPIAHAIPSPLSEVTRQPSEPKSADRG